MGLFCQRVVLLSFRILGQQPITSQKYLNISFVFYLCILQHKIKLGPTLELSQKIDKTFYIIIFEILKDTTPQLEKSLAGTFMHFCCYCAVTFTLNSKSFTKNVKKMFWHVIRIMFLHMIRYIKIWVRVAKTSRKSTKLS